MPSNVSHNLGKKALAFLNQVDVFVGPGKRAKHTNSSHSPFDKIRKDDDHRHHQFTLIASKSRYKHRSKIFRSLSFKYEPMLGCHRFYGVLQRLIAIVAE
jgi:hypothetical protein